MKQFKDMTYQERIQNDMILMKQNGKSDEEIRSLVNYRIQQGMYGNSGNTNKNTGAKQTINMTPTNRDFEISKSPENKSLDLNMQSASVPVQKSGFNWLIPVALIAALLYFQRKGV